MSSLRQGQGPSTPRKQEGFAATFAASLAISKAARIRSYPYWHLDCNAGTGYNEKAHCPGSPMVFLGEALARARVFNAYFCDHDRASVVALRKQIESFPLPGQSKAVALWMDNVVFLQHLAWLISNSEDPRYAVGSCLCDPNSTAQLPLGHLAAFAALFPRIDIILNVNLSFLAMKRKAVAGKKAFDAMPDFRAILDSIPRKHWMIRNPSANGGHHFSILVGRNIDTGHKQFMDFFPLDSAPGQHIVTYLSRWRDGQGDLFKK